MIGKTGNMQKHGEYGFRSMAEDDLTAVCAIERENFSQPWSRQGFADALKQNNTELLVCETEGILVGYCAAYITYDEADIVIVSVSETYRNRKIATGMLKKLMDILKEHGVTAVTLEVRAGNAPAIHVYEKLGFVNEGIRPDFYKDPTEDAIIMWLKDLDDRSQNRIG